MPPELHDRPVTVVGAVHSGDPERGLQETAPLRRLGTVLADLSAPMPFTAVQSGFDGLFPRGGQRSFWKSQYLRGLSDEVVETLAELARTRPAPLAMVEVMQMGGAIAQVDPERIAVLVAGMRAVARCCGMGDAGGAGHCDRGGGKERVSELSNHGGTPMNGNKRAERCSVRLFLRRSRATGCGAEKMPPTSRCA